MTKLFSLRAPLLAVAVSLAGIAAADTPAPIATDPAFGRYEIRTIPLDPALRLRSATYTASGKVLVVYSAKESSDERDIKLAVMNDDGSDMRTFFAQKIPERPKDNGLRFMMFADNKRIFLGDFVLECAPSIDSCDQSKLLPVEYPTEVADSPSVWHRWSEIIIAPDNESIAWTTLLANYSAMVFSGHLQRSDNGYRVADAHIISTVEPFRADPKHADGALPNPLRNGEVKQFVHGGSAISMVGAVRRDTPDSVVQQLVSGDIDAVTDTAGYNETTIFAPDERLGITMSARFSPASDLAILGLMPKPYPANLNMGVSMHAYTHAVTGVRQSREGNVGPALIDIEKSQHDSSYRGLDLHTQPQWVFHSPMSWHPDNTRAMWMEGERGSDSRFGRKMRMQMVHLLDYKAGKPVAAQKTPIAPAYASTDLSLVARLAANRDAADVTIYGQHSGAIHFKRSVTGVIEKSYDNFSDDGKNVYRGSEKMVLNPRGNSTYTADVTLTGDKPGRTELKMTFGPLNDALPSRLIFDKDDDGVALTHGYSEYDGKRLNVDDLIP